MTSNVNFTGNTYYSPKDIENLAKYATGVAISNKDNISATEVLTYPLIPTAISGMSWLKDNFGNYGKAMGSLKTQSTALHDIFVKGGNFKDGIKAVVGSTEAVEILKSIPDAKELANLTAGTQSLFAEAKAAAELAKTGSKDAIAKASKLFTEANAAAYAETAANATGFFGKVKNFLGITKAGNAINKLAVKSPAFGKCLNTFKAQGGGIMLALEGGVELVSNVIPTFKQLGAKAGIKQVGKSAVKTVASVGGWVAGAALGTKIGAVIGSVIPGAGTAVGAVVGAAIGSICSLLGGSLGSRLAKSGAEKLVGKDELVIAQENQAKELAKVAQIDNNVLNEVVNVASERLNEEGVASDDSKIAYNSLNAVTSGNSIATKTQTTTNPFKSQTAQSVYGSTNPNTSSYATPSFTGSSAVDFYNKDFMAAINGLA